MKCLQDNILSRTQGVMLLENSLKSVFRVRPLAFIRMMSEKQEFKKPKYDGRSKKRKWEERRLDGGESLYEKREKIEPGDRIKKRKYAMLLGYSGSDYFGMQRNPGTKTVEEDLFAALLNAKLITQDAFDQVQSIQFQRAARTDKGVSASRQIVSIKLPETVTLQTINEFLPEVVRVFGLKRVTKGFNSKSSCDGRTYSYVLPSAAFADRKETVDQSTYRLSESSLKEINELLRNFIGTKNFHNFTSKKKPSDPSARRYIMSFECEKPFVREGVEFALLKVKGQSFMMHQIRKMIGLTIAIAKGHSATDVFDRAFTHEKVNVPRAPGLGLILDYVHYERYNNRYGADGLHEKLEWHEYDELVNSFNEKHIYPTIINTEINEACMLNWVNKLERHNYDVCEEDEPDEGKNGECSDGEEGNTNHANESLESSNTPTDAKVVMNTQ